MRLLWVENHAIFVRIAGRQFLAEHDLTVVPSLSAAQEMLATQTFDAVLVDFDLDDGKGTTVVEFARRSTVRVPIIAVSAHDHGNAALLSAGADVACPKTRFAEIGLVLQRVVRQQESP